jgi:predicted RNase H-like nuclease
VLCEPKRELSAFVTDRDRALKQGFSAEAVETLVWLAKSHGVDRRRYRIVSRLRSVRDSDQFADLPEDLRERVREIVADAER